MGKKSPPNLPFPIHLFLTKPLWGGVGVGVNDSLGSYADRLRTLLWLAVYVLLISTVSLPSALSYPRLS